MARGKKSLATTVVVDVVCFVGGNVWTRVEVVWVVGWSDRRCNY